jgi:putative flippase GtrA
MSLSIKQYSVYFIIGGIVGITAIVLREGIAWLIGDSPTYYALSVSLVYMFGILLSFILHRNFTFKEQKTPFYLAQFYSFILVAILGMLLTVSISIALRYLLHFDTIFNHYSGAISFCLAALTASVFSYYLNARFSFSKA